MVRVGETVKVLFWLEKMVKKGYCKNEGLGLAWSHIKVRQINLYITTFYFVRYSPMYVIVIVF